MNPSSISAREAVRSASVCELIYELLDAHRDTTELAERLALSSPYWRAHLHYLRDLQRVGREALARGATEAVR